jgi:hypothetical protein
MCYYTEMKQPINVTFVAVASAVGFFIVMALAIGGVF